MEETLVTAEDVRHLVEHFAKGAYRMGDTDCKGDEIMRQCKNLFAKDYKFSVINNQGGDLVSTYPSELVIPQQTKCACYENDPSDRSGNTVIDSFCDSVKLRDLMVKARVARCRARFPIPVIFCDGKYICRSATLSGGPEIYGRSGYDFLFAGSAEVGEDDKDVKEIENPQSSNEWQLFSKVRMQDIRLLKALSVGYICDLMVEKKKVKFGMNVTSSEKVDKENRYGEFTILSLPYPGCEFFRDYRDNGYNAEGLVFDWNQAFVDAKIGVPSDSVIAQLDIEWDSYKSWDLVRLTQNYLKLQLKYILEGTSGLLVHCISGWDRTPLFVSLLRLSLWADGKAHSSLSAVEIVFLTIAYDWYLFGHDLTDRLSKGEEIFFFCFYFLKYLVSEEFSANSLKSNRSTRNGSDCQLDGILFEGDSVKRGSDTSLNSSCSSISSRSQDNNPPMVFSTNTVRSMPINSATNCSSSVNSDIWDDVSLITTNGNGPSNSVNNYTWPSNHSFQQILNSKSSKLSDDMEHNVLTPGTPPTLTNSSSSDASGRTFNNGNESPPMINAKISSPVPALFPHTVATMALSTSSSSSNCSPSSRNLSPAANLTGISGITSVCSTSPVAVPNSLRQRSESSSSVGCGSWQIISGTGSIRGSSSTRSSLSSPTLELNHNSGHSKVSLCHDSGEFPLEKPICLSCNQCHGRDMRQERLQEVRKLFFNAYSLAIGFKHRTGNNENRGFSNFLDHVAEKVGFRTARSTAV